MTEANLHIFSLLTVLILISSFNSVTAVPSCNPLQNNQMMCFAILPKTGLLCSNIPQQLQATGLSWPTASFGLVSVTCSTTLPSSLGRPAPGPGVWFYYCLSTNSSASYFNFLNSAWGVSSMPGSFNEKMLALSVTFQCSPAQSLPANILIGSSSQALGVWFNINLQSTQKSQQLSPPPPANKPYQCKVAWGTWSQCSASCGGGTRYQFGTLLQDGEHCPSLLNTDLCFTQACISPKPPPAPSRSPSPRSTIACRPGNYDCDGDSSNGCETADMKVIKCGSDISIVLNGKSWWLSPEVHSAFGSPPSSYTFPPEACTENHGQHFPRNCPRNAVNMGALVFHGVNKTKVAFDYGEAPANSLFASTNTFLRYCPGCISSHKVIFYKRLTPIPSGFSMYSNMIKNWSSASNQLLQDFNLYGSYQDLIANGGAGSNPWQYCNYDGAIGFPRDCAPKSAIRISWNILNTPYGPNEYYFYVINTKTALLSAPFELLFGASSSPSTATSGLQLSCTGTCNMYNDKAVGGRGWVFSPNSQGCLVTASSSGIGFSFPLTSSGSYTKSVWVKRGSNTSTFPNAVSSHTGAYTSARHYLWITKNKMGSGHGDPVSIQVQDPTPHLNIWYHYVVVYDHITQTMTIYGADASVMSMTLAQTSSSINQISTRGWNPLAIGCFEDGSMMDGYIDNARVWDRALSVPEVNQVHTWDISNP